MSDVVVRALQPTDTPRLLELIDGLADYEKLPRPDADARRRLATDAVADPPRFRTLVAEEGGQVVGYAIYFFTYSTFKALPSLYLEDIFVLPEQRGQGAGIGLFRACAREAVAQGCGRMEWQVLSYVRDAQLAIRAVRDGGASVEFLLNPTPISGVLAVADAHDRMPEKSTFFHPKPPAGLVVRDLAASVVKRE